jgi:hypothetical protein
LGDFNEANAHFLAGSLFEFPGKETRRADSRLGLSSEECTNGALRSYVKSIAKLPVLAQLEAFNKYVKAHPHLDVVHYEFREFPDPDASYWRNQLQEAVNRARQEGARTSP